MMRSSTQRKRFLRPVAIALLLSLLLPCAQVQAQIAPQQTDLYPVRKDKKWGYSDRTGKVVIKPAFESAFPFADGLAMVEITRSSTQTFINAQGSVLEVHQSYGSSQFSEGMLLVKDGDKYGYVDKAGTVVIGFQFEDAGDFGDGLAPVKINAKWGYIDHAGKTSIAPQFTDAASFSEGLAEVTFDEVRPFPGFVESLARVDEDAHRKWGFIDRTGKMVIAPQFTLSGKFSQGLAPVGKGKEIGPFTGPTNQKWGYIDKTGKVVIGLQFNSASEFAEGLAAVKVGRKWGYIDTSGKWSSFRSSSTPGSSTGD
jgi:hypothetical protein